MRRIILMIIQILVVARLWALDPQAISLQAEDAYNKQDYPTAIELFTSLLGEGYSSAGLFYNLANAHFMAGHFAEARLYYERALRLDPHDGAIFKNLSSLKSSLPDQFAEVVPFAPVVWWQSVAGWLSTDGWAVWMLIGVWSLCTLIWLRWKSKWPFATKTWWVAIIVVGGLLVLTSALGISRQRMLEDHTEAVVMNKDVALKSAPDAYGADILLLHSGTKVTVLDSIGDMLKVELPNGDSGWLQAEGIERI